MSRTLVLFVRFALRAVYRALALFGSLWVHHPAAFDAVPPGTGEAGQRPPWRTGQGDPRAGGSRRGRSRPPGTLRPLAGVAPGHPERLCPEQALTPLERALERELWDLA
ncbi:DUF6059 family protein [Kitasatospora sp. NPDC054939]